VWTVGFVAAATFAVVFALGFRQGQVLFGALWSWAVHLEMAAALVVVAAGRRVPSAPRLRLVRTPATARGDAADRRDRRDRRDGRGGGDADGPGANGAGDVGGTGAAGRVGPGRRGGHGTVTEPEPATAVAPDAEVGG
jgi:hypothetical protein